MFGNLGEMAKLMQKAKTIQSDMARMKEELAESEFAGVSPCRQVEVLVSGDFRIRKVVIAPGAAVDRFQLEEMIAAAANDALDQAKEAARKRMTELTGGLNIPGLF